jgi:H+/Cl- antiporter ClcA
MPNNVQTEPGTPGMASLVGGIINDAQNLVRQEITLAKTEIQQEFNKTKTAAASLGVGGIIAFLGGIFLCFMLVHLLHWVTLPSGHANYDPAQLPLWACHGIVGFVLLLAGGVFLYRGVAKASEIQIPPKQTTETLKEII